MSDILLKVADIWVEEDCRACGGKGLLTDIAKPRGEILSLCEPCNGTGKVRKWPMRVTCERDTIGGCLLCEAYGGQCHEWCLCHSLGWTPLDDPMELLGVLGSLKARPVMEHLSHIGEWQVLLHMREGDDCQGQATDPKEALYLAAVKWNEARDA